MLTREMPVRPGGTTPEVVSIEEISVDGSTATAKVTLKVTFMGQTMEQATDITLTKVDGKWKFAGDDIIPSTGG